MQGSLKNSVYLVWGVVFLENKTDKVKETVVCSSRKKNREVFYSLFLT